MNKQEYLEHEVDIMNEIQNMLGTLNLTEDEQHDIMEYIENKL